MAVPALCPLPKPIYGLELAQRCVELQLHRVNALKKRRKNDEGKQAEPMPLPGRLYSAAGGFSITGIGWGGSEIFASNPIEPQQMGQNLWDTS